MYLYYPLLLLILGAIVLWFGKRLAVLGAAVGGLLGVALISIFSMPFDSVLALGLIVILAIGGFVLTNFTTSILDAILVVTCALGGAEIMIEVLGYFGIAQSGIAAWLLAIVGGLIGWLAYRFFRRITLLLVAEVIGALLVTRALTIWMPFLHGWPAVIIAAVLTALGVAQQNGYFAKRKAAAASQAQIAAAQAQAAAAQAQAAAAATPAATTTPAAPMSNTAVGAATPPSAPAPSDSPSTPAPSDSTPPPSNS